MINLRMRLSVPLLYGISTKCRSCFSFFLFLDLGIRLSSQPAVLCVFVCNRGVSEPSFLDNVL